MSWKLAFKPRSAPVDLTFGLRIATSSNFPGVFSDSAAGTVAPNTWTEVVFTIDPSSPLCSPESFAPTDTCADILANPMGHFQIGTDAPAALIALDQVITLDIDKVSTALPEPTTAALMLLGLGGLVAYRPHRRS